MDKRLRILTINIWNRTGPWDKRFPLLRAGIDALAPDVIGMQEVMSDGTNDLATEIAGELGYNVEYALAKELPAGVSLGNAVLSRHPIRNPQRFALPDAGTDERRSLLLTEIDTPHGPLPFACTHLAWEISPRFRARASGGGHLRRV